MMKLALIGTDASGKDTQAALLKLHFESQNKSVQIISIWDSLADFAEIKDKKTLQEIVETFLLKFEGHARSFFLLSCLKNAEAKIRPTTDVVILNGFYHKYWASEVAYGIESDFWIKNTETFTTPDKAFYLNVPVEECLKRKTNWSKYESGAAAGKIREEFQRQLHLNLNNLMQQLKSVIEIDGHQPEDAVTKEILKHL